VTDTSAPEDTEQPLCGRLAERYSHWRHDPFWNEIEQRPRAAWRLLVGALAVVVGYIGVLTGSIARIGTVVVPQWVIATFAAMIDRSVALLGGQVIGSGLIVLWIGVVAVVVGRRSLTDLGLSFDRTWFVDLGFGCLVGLAVTTGMLAVNIAAGWVTVTGILTGTIGQRFGYYALYVFIFTLCTGVREELIFRGFLLPNIAEGLRGFEWFDASRASWAAVIPTTVFFILWHLSKPLNTLVIAGVTGIVFGITYLLTDSLAIPIGFHAIWNFTAPLYGSSTGGTAGRFVVTASDPVVIGAGITSTDLVSWLAIGIGLLPILVYVRFRAGELQIQSSVSKPSFHDRQIGSRVRSWFDVHDDDWEPPTERELTDEEQHRLSPLLDKTDIPVKVKPSSALQSDNIIPPGGVAGWWPSTRRIVIYKNCFDRDGNEAALGSLARGMGQYAGRHHLIRWVVAGGIGVIALIVFITDTFGVFYAGQWLYPDRSYIGLLLISALGSIGGAALSRRLAYAANKHGATLLGSTEPLEVLYRSMGNPTRAWWEKLLAPLPTPAEQLAVLEKFSVNEEDSMSTVSRWLSDRP
jgi:membrane protease YdiL (CAAX protease family)